MMPLDDIRVLDLSRLAPGPFCTMMLGDLGADVIMVEGIRQNATGLPSIDGGRSEAYNALRRNKRSVRINLKDTKGRELFLGLAETADVVVEGFRPGVVQRLGVDYESVRSRKPDIVYCSLSGYGQTGRYAALPGHDINYISIGGALGMIGWPDSPPTIPMNLIADFGGGAMYAAVGILSALHLRCKTGEGQFIDAAMTDGVVSMLAMAMGHYFRDGEAARPGRDPLNGGEPSYNVYMARDNKWLSISCGGDTFWPRFCAAMGCENYADREKERALFPEMLGYLRSRFLAKPRDEWLSELTEKDLCVTPVYSMEEVVVDSHLSDRGMIVEMRDPVWGVVKQVGVAPKLQSTPGQIRHLGHRPGQDSADVLTEVGYLPAQIDDLLQSGVVGGLEDFSGETS